MKDVKGNVVNSFLAQLAEIAMSGAKPNEMASIGICTVYVVEMKKWQGRKLKIGNISEYIIDVTKLQSAWYQY